MSALSELKQFIEREETKQDPYWKSILLSDTRNIFPKHELSKIEIAKNRVAKLRLVMEHLTTFLSLQIYAKSIDNVKKSALEKEIKKELNELDQDITKCRTDNRSNDYDFQILEAKGKVEVLCRELAKQKIEPEFREILEKSAKWKQYLDNNCKTPEEYDPILNERDKTNLAFNISLKNVDQCLLTGTSGKIIEERTKEEIFKHRLRQIFAEDSLELNFPAENDPFSRQWREVEEQLERNRDKA